MLTIRRTPLSLLSTRLRHADLSRMSKSIGTVSIAAPPKPPALGPINLSADASDGNGSKPATDAGPSAPAGQDLYAQAVRLEKARAFVTAMCCDQEGNLWVGTEDGGVQKCDLKKPPLEAWTLYTAKDGLGDDSTYALACDKAGRIWVGHGRHGVSVFNGKSWQNYEVVGGISRPDSRSGPMGERIFAITVCPTDGDVWMCAPMRDWHVIA